MSFTPGHPPSTHPTIVITIIIFISHHPEHLHYHYHYHYDHQVDYREFAISGKCLIIEKEEKRGNPPVTGWLSRQRKFANDPSTYTWKNHMKWYRQRMSESVVWLMRRAQNAITQDAMMVEAIRNLTVTGHQARATAFLFEQGFLALQKRASKKVFPYSLFVLCPFVLSLCLPTP